MKYWTIVEFKKVVAASKTIREVLCHFGLPGNQGHYNRLFHKTVKEHGIDISHILKFNETRQFLKKISVEEFFINGKKRDGESIKKKLIELGTPNICAECKISPQWNGKPLVLQVDHINGDHIDNRIENIRLLCPNCHTQTDTWSGRNAKKQHAYKHVCKDCEGYKKDTQSDRCVKCENQNKKSQTKIDWPPAKEVDALTKKIGFSAAGRQLGVSDNAIRKFLKRSTG